MFALQFSDGTYFREGTEGTMAPSVEEAILFETPLQAWRVAEEFLHTPEIVEVNA